MIKFSTKQERLLIDRKTRIHFKIKASPKQILLELLARNMNFPTIPLMLSSLLTTFFAAMLPLVELRLALPVGYIKLGLSLPVATLVSILGNIIAIGIALWLWPHVVRFAEKRIPWFHRILEKIFHRTRTKHSQKVIALGEIFLVAFVAVPLPGSGGWTGSLVAFLFGMRYWTAMKFISIGVILSGLIVAALTYFGVEIFSAVLAS